jgi:hypothetical protein
METVLSASTVILYGRVVEDLQILQKTSAIASMHPAGLGANQMLLAQIAKGDALLARIYAFSFEGHSWDLYRPAIFLVHGPGVRAEPNPPPNRAAVAPASADETGVAAQSYSYSSDMMMWTYEKADLSIRMDVETGSFEQILLESVLNVEAPRTPGARVDATGARADLAGARVAGARATIRGNRGGWSD